MVLDGRGFEGINPCFETHGWHTIKIVLRLGEGLVERRIAPRRAAPPASPASGPVASVAAITDR
jgi:hypothetical protein